MIVAYQRISTKKQDLSNQDYQLLKYAQTNNLKIDKMFKETISSKIVYEKRLLKTVIDQMNEDDTFLVTEFSRIGRSSLEVMSILEKLLKKNIKVHIIKYGYVLGNDIQSQILVFAFSIAAQIERDLISRRTKDALTKKKAEGMILGRKKGYQNSVLDKKHDEIIFFLKKKLPITSIAKLLDVSPQSIYYYFKTRNIDYKNIKEL